MRRRCFEIEGSVLHSQFTCVLFIRSSEVRLYFTLGDSKGNSMTAEGDIFKLINNAVNLTSLLKKVEKPNRTLDAAFGTTLIIGMVIGIPANLICCYFFSTQRSSHENGTYFKRIYTLISSLDLAICILLFPIIEVLFVGRQNWTLLFHDKTFCLTWYAMWSVCQEMVIFMVAMLSVSRIVFLKYPHLEAKPNSAWIIPGIVAILVAITLFIGPLASGKATVKYKPNYSSCQIDGLGVPLIENVVSGLEKSSHSSNSQYSVTPNIAHTVTSTVNPTATPSAGFDALVSRDAAWALSQSFDSLSVTIQKTFTNKSTIFLLKSCLFGLPVLPIFISVLLCWIFLRRANARAKKTNATVIKHGQASSTVLIVTLVYVIFNIPALLFSIYLVYSYTQNIAVMKSTFDELEAAITYGYNFGNGQEGNEILDKEDAIETLNKGLNIMSEWISDLTSRVHHEKKYATLSFILLPVLYCCLHPIIVYWRLQPFRFFISNRLKHPDENEKRRLLPAV